MSQVDDIRREMAENWLSDLYSTKVRALRTRAYSLEVPERENTADIMHTLLGIELKVGRRRFECPDLATARYLRVFARLGCQEFAIPYDITKISAIADELETSWQRLLLLASNSPGGRLRSQAIKSIRDGIKEIGPGEKMPEFKSSTGQRRG